MMLIDSKFEIGNTVYLKTDIEQKKRLVTGIYVRETSVAYMLSCGADESTHYHFEISEEVDVLITSNY